MLEYYARKMEFYLKSEYFMKGKFKMNLINIIKGTESLKRETFVFIPYNGLERICYPTNKPFMEIKTNGTENVNVHCINIEKLYVNLLKRILLFAGIYTVFWFQYIIIDLHFPSPGRHRASEEEGRQGGVKTSIRKPGSI